jgi:hypothetical protein
MGLSSDGRFILSPSCEAVKQARAAEGAIACGSLRYLSHSPHLRWKAGVVRVFLRFPFFPYHWSWAEQPGAKPRNNSLTVEVAGLIGFFRCR